MKIRFSSISKKFLKKCDTELKNRLIEKIETLKEEPFPQDAVRVIGRKEKSFRIRVGSWRMVYSVFIEDDIIFISEINKRSKVYN